MSPTNPVSVQVPAPKIFGFLQNIINKKVNGVALNFFEKIVDFFGSCLSSYNDYYQYCLAQRNVSPIASQPITSQPSVERTHYLRDNVPLIDRTQAQIAGVERISFVSLITPQRSESFYITLRGHRVLLHGDPNMHNEYCREGHTREVIIQDHPQRSNFIEIVEFEENRSAPNPNREVNLDRKFRLTTFTGDIPFENREVYVVEDQIQNIPHQLPTNLIVRDLLTPIT